jgi:hypothetical protein
LDKSPDDAVVLENLGATCRQMGRAEEAADAYCRCLPFHPDNPLYELRIDALCPPVFPSVEAIDRFHRRLDAALDRYVAMQIHADPMTIPPLGCEPPFDAAYHGRDERAWREKFAAIFRNCFPHANRPAPSGADRPRIAMVVTRDHEGIFLRCTRGLIENFDPERFDVSVVCAHSGLARIREAIDNPGVAYLPVPDKFEKWVETLGGGRFDLLYFFEVGSDAFNYFLPFLRLAPVQCVGMGTAHTTGIPEMDYYVSSDLIESPGAESHYTERLVRRPTCSWTLGPMAAASRPTTVSRWASRSSPSRPPTIAAATSWAITAKWGSWTASRNPPSNTWTSPSASAPTTTGAARSANGSTPQATSSSTTWKPSVSTRHSSSKPSAQPAPQSIDSGTTLLEGVSPLLPWKTARARTGGRDGISRRG